MAVSVCMATYNCEQYVARQMRSILEQLGPADNVIVVDDCSKDQTIDVIRNLNDSRITIQRNAENRGEVYSFGKAMASAKGDVVFLADQDDVWLPGRVESMVRRLQDTRTDLVTSNFYWMDSAERPIGVYYDGVRASDSDHYLKNVLDIFMGKTTYFGCAMAFTRKLLQLLLPIPKYVESHDLWIALAANVAKSNVHMDERTFRKRRHRNNLTSTVSNRSLYLKLRSRVIFAICLLELRKRAH